MIRGTKPESGEKRSSPAARLHEACCEPIPWLLRAMGLTHIRLPNREEEAWCTTGYDHRDAVVRLANPADGKIHSKRCQIMLPIMVWALPSPLLILVLAVVAGSASAQAPWKLERGQGVGGPRHLALHLPSVRMQNLLYA